MCHTRVGLNNNYSNQLAYDNYYNHYYSCFDDYCLLIIAYC